MRKSIKITEYSYFQDMKEKLKAEAATAADSLPILSSFGEHLYNAPPTFSMDDFEGNIVLFCECGMPAIRFTLCLPRFQIACFYFKLCFPEPWSCSGISLSRIFWYNDDWLRR